MIRAILSNGDQSLIGDGTLLDLCIKNGIPLASSCGGKGVCGKCIITIHDGQSQLMAPNLLEQTKLYQLRTPNNIRLGCQVHSEDLTCDLSFSTSYW